MATVTVDQAKLVLNAFAARFQNTLVSRDIVTWNEMDSEFDDRNALEVVEQVTPRYVVTRTTGGVKDLSSGRDGTVFGSERFKIDGTFNVNMGIGDFAKIRDLQSARESEVLTSLSTQMAEQVDAYILGIAGKASNNWTGTVGNAFSDQNDVVSGYTRLKEEGVGDNDLATVLTYGDRQGLGNQVIGLQNVDFTTDTYQKGFESAIAGIPTKFTQQLPALTVGTRAASGAALINGAAQNSNYASVAISSSPGFFMTQTIAIDTLTAGHTVKAGEVFTIAGVNAYDNRKQASLGRLQQFTVIADATADGGGAIATLRIFPAIIVPGSGSGDNININTAHATVTAAPADNAAITWLGTASATLTARMIIQKSAVVVNTAPLVMPYTGTAMRKRLSQVPISVRMWQHSDPYTGEHMVRFDMALNANIRDRRRIVRINGA